MSQGISILVHGFAKAGKSRFGATSPVPRVVLDAEAGSRFVPGWKIRWEPSLGGAGWRGQDPVSGIWTWGGSPPPPPTADFPWDTCLVPVRQYADVDLTYQYLRSGQHPFASLVVDSVSEVQRKCADQIVGTGPLKQQDWGTLLRLVSGRIREFRDLIAHPTHPLMSIVYICETAEKNSKIQDKFRPNVQGALRDVLPYIPDVCGYLWVDMDPAGQPVRHLLVGPHPSYESGERVGGVLGYVIDNPNVQTMLQTVLAAQQAYQR